MAISVAERVGPWAICADWQDAHIEDTRTGEVFTTCVTRFPIGYRVGLVWTNGLADCTDHLPEHVKGKARGLARRLG